MRFFIPLCTAALFLASSLCGAAEERLVETEAQRLNASESVGEPRYGLGFDKESLHKAGSIVVVVHGYNSTPERTIGLIQPVIDEELPWGWFAYPNDQPLMQSAQLLSSELKRLVAQHPEKSVSLVTHSMGGLVARACVEQSRLNPDNVDRLIMVAPPSRGSRLADYAFGADLWEHWVARQAGSPWQRTRGAFLDGLGEAADDLVPGSDFLTELNARPRNPKVAYTLIAGDGGSISPERRAWFCNRSTRALRKLRAKKTAQRLEAYIQDFDELIEGEGDGAVALKRATIPGVDDVVVLPFGHLNVIRGIEGVEARRLILQRVRSPVVN